MSSEEIEEGSGIAWDVIVLAVVTGLVLLVFLSAFQSGVLKQFGQEILFSGIGKYLGDLVGGFGLV